MLDDTTSHVTDAASDYPVVTRNRLALAEKLGPFFLRQVVFTSDPVAYAAAAPARHRPP